MQSALKTVKGVSEAVVTMPNKAVITAEKEVKVEDLIAAVEAAGFKAKEEEMMNQTVNLVVSGMT